MTRRALKFSPGADRAEVVDQHIPRRQFLRLAGGAAALSAASYAEPQSYPTRPVRLIVGFPAAGPGDILARLIGQLLSERLGQNFVVDNRPGAGGNIGTEAAVRAPRDGHTLLVISAANASNAPLYPKLPFNFMRDITPIGGIYEAPFVAVVHPSIPVRTIPELIAYARAYPGKLNMGSPGIGSTVHMCGELFKMMTGVDMVHVPIRTGAMPALLSGELHLQFAALPVSITHIRAGRLRALAVTSVMRSEALPDVPSVGDFVLGYEATDWYGIGAPTGTPAWILDKLGQHLGAALHDHRAKTRVGELGGTPFVTSPSALAKRIAIETERWTKVVRFSGIKAE